jgi:hypothetical protein
MITHWEVALTYIKERRTLTATALFSERKRPPSSSFVFNLLEVVRQRLHPPELKETDVTNIQI